MTMKLNRIARGTGGAVMLSTLLLACNIDTLLDVPDPDVATPQSVLSKAALPAVLAGAVGDYMVAYNSDGDGQISMSALFTDELIWAETFPTRFEVDVRSIQVTNVTMEGVFRNLHRARISASRAATGYASLDPTNVAPYAEALNLEAMAYINFGENYCNGVPFSRLDDAGAPVYGDPITNDAMFTQAVVLLDSALTVLGTPNTAADSAQRNFAQIARGRALLNRGQYANAAAAVAGVPSNFSYTINHSQNTARQNNGLWSLVFVGRRFATGQNEGVNGLPYRTDAAAGDPRIPNQRGTGATSTGFDGSTPLFTQLKYPLRDSPAPVVTGAEARLIEAEASLQAGTFGNAGGGLAIINTLRGTTTPALAAELDPGTAAGRENLLFRERAYWLWLTAHRLGDMRRLMRQYGRTEDAVFPTGAFFKGGVYGDDVNFPVPFDEQNNRKFQQCIDRNA